VSVPSLLHHLLLFRTPLTTIDGIDDIHIHTRPPTAAACPQVLFHAPSHKLISASEDGLVAVHDVAAGLNQDDGFIAALSVGTSVLQLGLYGAGGQHMWCRTGVWRGVRQGSQQFPLSLAWWSG
jgi:hypothetical protein